VTWLDDEFAGAARDILAAGTPVPARAGLNFGTGLTAVDNGAQDRTDVSVDLAATNAELLDHETRIDTAETDIADIEAALGETRTGTLDLVDSQAWTEIGAPLSLAANTTAHYEIAVQVSWTDHTVYSDGSQDVDAATYVRTVRVAVVRDSADGEVIVQADGGTSWDVGPAPGIGTYTQASLRAVAAGANGWQLEWERGSLASELTTTATITCTVVRLSSAARSGDVNVLDPVRDELLDHETRIAANEGIDTMQSAILVDHETRIGGLEALPPGVTLPLHLDTDTDADRAIYARQDDGTTKAPLSLDASDLIVTDGATRLSLLASGAGQMSGSGAQKRYGSSTIDGDASGNFTRTYTPAAAATIVHSADVTSLSDTMAQAASGAGHSKSDTSGLGASGSKSGDFTIGLPSGGNTLGAKLILETGTSISNVSDPVSMQCAGSEFLKCYQSAASTTTVTTSNTLNIGAGSPATIQVYANGLVQVTSNTNLVQLGGTSVSSTSLASSGQISANVNSVAYAASVTLNCNLGNHHKIAAMTGDITSLTLSNAKAGAEYTVEVAQDGSGLHTVAWNANFRFGVGYSNVADSVASHRTIWKFRTTSTTQWDCIGKETFTS